jgi:hypothetical protein
MTTHHFPQTNSSPKLEEILRLARICLTLEEFSEFLQKLSDADKEVAA